MSSDDKSEDLREVEKETLEDHENCTIFSTGIRPGTLVLAAY